MDRNRCSLVQPFSNPLFTSEESDAVFNDVARRLELLMNADRTIFIEGVFATARRIERIATICDKPNIILRTYLLACDRETALTRIRGRASVEKTRVPIPPDRWDWLALKMDSQSLASLQIRTDFITPTEIADRIISDFSHVMTR